MLPDGPRTCAFCGAEGPLTLEHLWPAWTEPYIKGLGAPQSITRVSDHGEHVHDVWATSGLNLTARRVCRTCNNGWMHELEEATKPTLVPLITSTEPRTFSRGEAVTLATWITKTCLTTEFMHPGGSSSIAAHYYSGVRQRKRPILNSVVWIAAYEGRYPASTSTVATPALHGFRITGNIGHLAFKVTVADDLATTGLVLPDNDQQARYLSQIWPRRLRRPLGSKLAAVWPGSCHSGRLAPVMNDRYLRDLSEVGDHAWGAE